MEPSLRFDGGRCQSVRWRTNSVAERSPRAIETARGGLRQRRDQARRRCPQACGVSTPRGLSSIGQSLPIYCPLCASPRRAVATRRSPCRSNLVTTRAAEDLHVAGSQIVPRAFCLNVQRLLQPLDQQQICTWGCLPLAAAARRSKRDQSTTPLPWPESPLDLSPAKRLKNLPRATETSRFSTPLIRL